MFWARALWPRRPGLNERVASKAVFGTVKGLAAGEATVTTGFCRVCEGCSMAVRRAPGR
jgi:hypothetical protein